MPPEYSWKATFTAFNARYPGPQASHQHRRPVRCRCALSSDRACMHKADLQLMSHPASPALAGPCRNQHLAQQCLPVPECIQPPPICQRFEM